MRELRSIGKEITMIVKLYDMPKYKNGSKVYDEDEYYGVTSWEIITNEDAKEIEKDMNNEEMDILHEYVTLIFFDGSTATLRNSNVDLFIK